MTGDRRCAQEVADGREAQSLCRSDISSGWRNFHRSMHPCVKRTVRGEMKQGVNGRGEEVRSYRLCSSGRDSGGISRTPRGCLFQVCSVQETPTEPLQLGI